MIAKYEQITPYSSSSFRGVGQPKRWISIAVVNKDLYWVLDYTNGIPWFVKEDVFTEFEGSHGKKIHATKDGTIYLINTNGKLYKLIGTLNPVPKETLGYNTWKHVQAPFKFLDVSTGSNGRIWAVSTNNSVYTMNSRYTTEWLL